MKSCQDYQELISRLLDGELTEAEQRDVERHIASCSDCAAMYEAFRALSQTIGEDPEEPPERLHEKIMADVRREALRRRQAPKRVRSLLAIAACAALVLLAAVNLPRMGSASTMSAAAPAGQAAIVDSEEFALHEAAEVPAEAPSDALYAAGAAMDTGAERAEAEEAGVPSMPAPAPESEQAYTPKDELPPEAAEAEAPASRGFAWPLILVGLPLGGAAVLLLTRKKAD